MLRVAVTGHRPGRLASAAEQAVRLSLDALFVEIGQTLAGVAADHSDVFAGAPSVTLLSSLAEGSDRIAAEAALQAGWQLECVLPRPRDSYQRDFGTEPSRDHFDALLAKAHVMELEPGATPEAGYEAAGLMTLNQADLLVAVWDGGDSAGAGGTTALVEWALAQDIPVLWIDAADGRRRGLVGNGGLALPPRRQKFAELIDTVDADPAVLAATVAGLVAPPGGAHRAALEQYLGEPVRRIRLNLTWPLLMLLAGRTFRRGDFIPRAAPAEANDSGPDDSWDTYLRRLTQLGEPLPGLVDVLPERAGAADQRATFYGARYRSGFASNFLAAAFAIVFAILGLLFEPGVKIYLVGIEFVLIAYVLRNTRSAIKHCWHDRWLDRRALAERLRHLRLLALAGIRPWGTRPGGGALEMDWTTWYLRATFREIGIPQVAVGPDYLDGCRHLVLDTELPEQIAYNRRAAAQAHTLEARLHLIGSVLFGLTMAACACFAVVYWGLSLDHATMEHWAHWIGAVSAVLPTLGAALYAIRAHADFEDVHDRTVATAIQLEQLAATLRTDPASFALLSDRIERAVEAMSIDVADWRLVFEARPIGLPA